MTNNLNTSGGTTVATRRSNKRNKFGYPDCVRLAKGGVELTKSELTRVKLGFFLLGIMVTIVAAMVGAYVT